MKKQLTGNSIADNQNKSNIETRFANRAKSIFASTGQIVNDFYLEIGIYCIGLFNAGLVGWDIYTDLYNEGQPLIYAVLMGLIALIAVEGLAVYLVGAAAKTNNGLLWFFSVVFAGFFTFAHYREMTNNGIINEYIMLAIPFFVVIGYWARTIKVEVETGQVDKAQLEREELERRRKIEDEERQFVHQKELISMDKKQQIDLARIEAKKVESNGQFGLISQESRATLTTANHARQGKISQRRDLLLSLVNDDNEYTQKELAEQLGVSLGTVKNDLKSLNGSVKK